MTSGTNWYEAEPLFDASTRISIPHSSLQVYMFLIEGRDDDLLIGSGIGAGDLAGFVDTLVDSEPLLALTHSHWDHIGNAHQFERIVMHPAELTDDGRITIGALSNVFVKRPQQFVEDQLEEGLPFPDDFDPETFDIPAADGVEPIEPGDTIDLGDRSIEVVALPGHSPGHVGFLDRTNSILYVGDAIRDDGKVLAHFESSDLDAYRESVNRTRELRDEGAFDILASAHGEHLQGEDLMLLDELSDALDAILAGELDYEVAETDRDGTPIRQYETEHFEIKTQRDL